MKIFRTILGILILLGVLLIIAEAIYYSHFEPKTLYYVIPITIFGCLLIYHRKNKTLFEIKTVQSSLTVILLVASSFIHAHIQAASCMSRRCDYAIGYPFPMFIATDTSSGFGLMFIVGPFLNYLFYYLLLSLLIRAFKKKTSSNTVH